MRRDPNHFIQRNDGQDVGFGPPVGIVRVEVRLPRGALHIFTGDNAETDANACLVEYARNLPEKSPPRSVGVVTLMLDGYEYHAEHQVRFCEPDGTIRSRIAQTLMHFLDNEAYRRHYNRTDEELRRCLQAVAGVPNQVLRAEYLRLHALEEQGKHTLRQSAECGMEEYYALLVRFLELGCQPDEAVEKARKEAEADFLPNRDAPLAVPDSESEEYLNGIEAACHEAHLFLSKGPEAQP